jgi:hypothetical protein
VVDFAEHARAGLNNRPLECPECGHYRDDPQHEYGCTQYTDSFTTLDSGERAEFPSGMVRDTDAGKPRYDLIPLSMLKRLAELYARGAVKYGDRNWENANSKEEMERFQASAFRHFVQWLMGERDEDHASAVVFNVFAAETLRDKLSAE